MATISLAGVLIITLCVLLLNILARVVFAKKNTVKDIVGLISVAPSGIILRRGGCGAG